MVPRADRDPVAVEDRAAQAAVRKALLDTGYQVTPVIDRDYFSVPADQIDDIVVLETWVAGEKVFDRQEAER